jgi:hypothetical protein
LDPLIKSQLLYQLSYAPIAPRDMPRGTPRRLAKARRAGKHKPATPIAAPRLGSPFPTLNSSPPNVSPAAQGHGCVVQDGEFAFLGFGRRDEADGLQKPASVEPVHPLEGCELDGLEAPPRPASMDDSPVEAIDRLGEALS